MPVMAPAATSFNRHFSISFMDRKEVTNRVLERVKGYEGVEADKVTEESSFKDLGLDSLDGVEVVMSFEEEFLIEIPDADSDKIVSVKDAIDYIAAHPEAK